MQVVIDISKELYEKILNLPNFISADATQVIRDGTPLPKGHGRLGDLDALREEVSSWGMNDYEPSDFVDAIDEADTIIEANKGDKE